MNKIITKWPISKPNTILNICPAGFNIIVERLGSPLPIQKPGWFIAIPFVDRIKYVVDQRELSVVIDPQKTITKDNVQVNVSGNVFMKFIDTSKAAYGSTNPVYNVSQHAQSAMRSAIGRMELDELLHNRMDLNKEVQAALETSAVDWGIEIKRYELTEIKPDDEICRAMDKQAAAERVRREQILGAEGNKKKSVLEAEGNAEALRIKAESEADAIRIKYHGFTTAMEFLAKILNNKCSQDAVKVKLVEDYIKMYGDIGQKSNTIFFGDKGPDVNKLIAEASAVFRNIPGTKSPPV